MPIRFQVGLPGPFVWQPGKSSQRSSEGPRFPQETGYVTEDGGEVVESYYQDGVRHRTLLYQPDALAWKQHQEVVEGRTGFIVGWTIWCAIWVAAWAVSLSFWGTLVSVGLWWLGVLAIKARVSHYRRSAERMQVRCDAVRNGEPDPYPRDGGLR